MKKFSFFLLVLLISRIGFAYASPGSSQVLNIQSFFLGNQSFSNVNVNQVLAVLVGPQGAPGAAGAAGRDGFVGMNGQDGKMALMGRQVPLDLRAHLVQALSRFLCPLAIRIACSAARNL